MVSKDTLIAASLLEQIGDLSSAGALPTVPVAMGSRVGAESD
jgi:hypothetical protein